MAKIIKVGSQNLTPNKIANPFKTSRNSTTNPFKYSNFEGNTLQFADVFEGFQPKNTNKLKMIASSVAGSMNKIRGNAVESIINFVHRVGDGISSAWDFTVNKSLFELPYEQAVRDFMTAERHLPTININGITESMANIGKGISSRMEFLNTDIVDIGKDMAEKWAGLISKVHPKKYTASTPVSELEIALREALANDAAVREAV